MDKSKLKKWNIHVLFYTVIGLTKLTYAFDQIKVVQLPTGDNVNVLCLGKATD